MNGGVNASTERLVSSETRRAKVAVSLLVMAFASAVPNQGNVLYIVEGNTDNGNV
jgi:hypothetical protein